MYNPKLDVQLAKLSSDLIAKNYSLLNEVFDTKTIEDINLAFEKKRAALRPAKIGKGKFKTKCSAIRNDYIAWLNNDDHGFVAMEELVNQIFPIIKRELYLPLKRHEMQMALYPRGHFYKKHSDRHKSMPSRLLSLVFYLNHWQENDGGELLLYTKENVKIPPLINTCVIFLSEVEHEVLPTNKERKSITVWFRDDIN